MKIFAETPRLILREIIPSDDAGLFELDSNPEVHRYLGNNPVKNIEQIRDIIQLIRQQYIDNGIGRWAVIEKSTGDFMGWSGLKLVKETIHGHTNYHDLGYRFIQKYWGHGFATEAAKASVDYGFETLLLNDIYAFADIKNIASKNVLQKSGLQHIADFDYEETVHCWLRMTREDWIKKSRSASL